ncbi:unnamed protein product [Brachionus calyciflorus]|uniref:Spike glycoprotein fusion domain-containing protein n=1 Tax=Brachionus calyciflorus TaxID=104777 RepID=A0A813T4E9_9BILA|nr:unnamed protein product [Brachionus calyciflorus]
MINLKTICSSQTKKTKLLVKEYLTLFNSSFGTKSTTRKLFMMGKVQHQVYGTFFHCLKKRHILTTSMSFFGEKYESLRTENVKLSRDECFLMIKNKECHGNKMDCNNEYCTFSSNPLPTFSWMSERQIESFSCATSPKLITADSPSDTLFNVKCKVSDRECLFHESIVVWDSTIYHECPLYKIGQETFTIHQDSDVVISDMLGLTLLKTIEGIFVSIKTNNQVSNFALGGANINELKELLQAESNFRSVKDIEEKNDLLLRECYDFKSILNIFQDSKIDF